jgi:hypothetical protein
MCQLEQAIQEFQNLVRINDSIPDIEDNELDYQWKEKKTGLVWHETDVNAFFQTNNGQMLDAIRHNILDADGINQELKGVLDLIFQWGNILKFSKYKVYQCILGELWRRRDDNHVFQYDIPQTEMRLTIDPSCPVCYNLYNIRTKRFNSSEVTSLETWTKVLAAYDPARFWIYDARVALALLFLSRCGILANYSWFIPKPSSKNIQRICEEINNNNLNAEDADPKESYRRYLDILLRQEPNGRGRLETASHFEKKLFMLGGAIRDRYKRRNQTTRRAIIALGCAQIAH